MADNYNAVKTRGSGLTAFLVRLVVGAVVLAITAALTPGFRIAGLWSLIVSAVVLALADYLVSRLLGIDASPFGRGITGFIAAAVIIYATAYFVRGFDVTVWGALIGALVYGIIDAIIPGRAM
jgi:uncharacterized membrane protein YvlD (DUF360 family)